MIRMRSSEGQMVPLIPAQIGRWMVLLVTLATICLFSWSMRPAQSSGAVVRVSLAKVPEERIVTFGHETRDYAALTLSAPDTRGSDDQTGQDISPSTIRTAARLASRPDQPRQMAPPQKVRADANGILPITYSLPEGVSSTEGGVGVAKTLAAEGGQATGLTIFLIGDALIEIDRNELLGALARLGAQERVGQVPQASASGRLSLDRVRTAGIDLRYDAVRDRLVLRP